MAECASVNCDKPASEIWSPESDVQFDFAVCGSHGLELRAGATYTVEGRQLHIESLPRLVEIQLKETGLGGLPILTIKLRR